MLHITQLYPCPHGTDSKGSRSHCAGIPDFARTVRIFGGQYALRAGSYKWTPSCSAGHDLVQEPGGPLVGLGVQLGEPGFEQLVGTAGCVGAAEGGLSTHDPPVELFLVAVDGDRAVEGR